MQRKCHETEIICVIHLHTEVVERSITSGRVVVYYRCSSVHNNDINGLNITLLLSNVATVKLVLRGHIWEKESSLIRQVTS